MVGCRSSCGSGPTPEPPLCPRPQQASTKRAAQRAQRSAGGTSLWQPREALSTAILGPPMPPGPGSSPYAFHPRTFLTATTDGDEGNQSSNQSQECQKGLKQLAQTLSAHRSAPGCCQWSRAILALRARLLHAPTHLLRAAVLQHDRVREVLDPSPSQQPQINAGEFPQGRCDFNLQGLGEAAQRPDTCWLKPIVRLRPLLL